jgi:hypothetical protein
MRLIKRVVLASLLMPALALAQPKTADDWYKQGEQHYNLGEFDKAAEAFKQGFASETDDTKKPAYLYNVAQSYRQANKCRDSAFFYKRYLSLKEQDTAKPLKPEKKAEIEARIAELEECARVQAGGAPKPPGTGTTKPPGTGTTVPPGTGTTKPPGTGTTVPPGTGTTKPPGTGTTVPPGTGTTVPPGTGTTVPPGTDTTVPPGTGTTGTDTVPPGTGTQTRPTTTTQPPPTTVSVVTPPETTVDDTFDDGGRLGPWGDGPSPKFGTARFETGVTTILAGDLDMGTRATFHLSGGYPVFVKDKLLVEAGATFAYAPVPYHNFITDGSGRASLVNVLASGFGTYIVAPKISVRADLGLGMLFFGGLGGMGNPFTEAGASTSGTLTMFAFRLGASADYEITKNIIATATPLGFTISPAKAGLRSDVGAITRFDFMLGVGYRM